MSNSIITSRTFVSSEDLAKKGLHREKENSRKIYLATQKNSILRHLKPLSDGIYGPQPEDDQQPLYVPENNLVEENITFPSTSQIEDPALWPKILMNSFREILVQQGSIKLKEEDFPKDDHGRKFSVMYYYYILKGIFQMGKPMKENG
ncbi:zinc finger MYM-type protein 5-like [Hydra vulgaris]|uniref:Zinc finger MYM-type protein 5-like n=1 Tax=Hydra vulgaris TaxID=6087 RepID=A0ABM4D6H8_HYDVU